MRRAILGVFLLLAACGGDVRKGGEAVNRAPQTVDQRAERARYLMTSDAQEVIASFARSYAQDALDTCLNAWVDENAAEILGAPASKPHRVLLRWFLAQCLAGAVPGDVRADRDQGLRSDRPAEARADTSR
ncbi:MAG: hypothetical protein EHM78_04620 [Myxococcaceae bacterium]|nr:MAG: hypothetical protein EHM78_04620 [Myxococcaceae bacterium]